MSLTCYLPCDDILGKIGEEVKKIREEETHKWYVVRYKEIQDWVDGTGPLPPMSMLHMMFVARTTASVGSKLVGGGEFSNCSYMVEDDDGYRRYWQD